MLTQNVYLGAGLLPALDAADAGGFAAAVEQIHAAAVGSDFAGRAGALADLLAEERPDVVGLQEVARWSVTPGHTADVPPSPPLPPAPPVLDFLAHLETAFSARGLPYRVAVVGEHADIDQVPLGDSALRLQSRGVVLVRVGPGLRWSQGRAGRYEAQQVVRSPAGVPLSFQRGWASVELELADRRVRFVSTHLEVEQYARVQAAQAEELLAGPADTAGPVVVVGDLNSAADGTTTGAYARLTSAGFADVWSLARPGEPGLTCCQAPDLANASSMLASRIDYVLVRGGVEAVDARLVGDRPYRDIAPRWLSDHAGVLATLELR